MVSVLKPEIKIGSGFSCSRADEACIDGLQIFCGNTARSDATTHNLTKESGDVGNAKAERIV